MTEYNCLDCNEKSDTKVCSTCNERNRYYEEKRQSERSRDVKTVIDYIITHPKIYNQILDGGPRVPQGNLQKFLEQNDEQFKRWFQHYKFLRRSIGLEQWPIAK